MQRFAPKASAPKRGKWTRDKRGRNHPSAEEAAWFDALYQQEARGAVRIIAIEPSFRIPADTAAPFVCNVKADAELIEQGRRRVVDYKGFAGDTAVSRLKRRLVRWQHDVEIELVGPYVERLARQKRERKAKRDLIKKAARTAKPAGRK